MILCNTAVGQRTVNNFEIEGGTIWRKVFETNITFEQLTEKIKDSGLFKNMEISESKVTGDIKQLVADYKGSGFSRGLTPIYVLGSYFKGFSIIEFKEGKYRVTLKNIVLVQMRSDPLGEKGEETNLDTYALKSSKDEFKAAFMKAPSLILNHTFENKFSFKNNEKEDW